MLTPRAFRTWLTLQVFVSAQSQDPPLLSLVGGATRTVLRASSLKINAVAKVVSCVIADKTNSLAYRWSEVNYGQSFTSTSAVSQSDSG